MTNAKPDPGTAFNTTMARFVDAALRNDDSILTPGRAIWIEANLRDLHHRFVEAPDQSADSFINKLPAQLAGANADVVQLMVEVFFMHLLIASNVKGNTKRQLLRSIAALSSEPVSVPDDLDPALDGGRANTGIAYLTYRYFQVAFFITSMLRWKQLPQAERDQALADPWAFKAWLFSQPISRAYAQREALLHYVHPDVFEPIVSREHKAKYAKQWATYAATPSDDVDRMLYAIRQGYEQRHGVYLNFYTPPPQSIPAGEAPRVATVFDQSPLPRSLGSRLRPYVDLASRLNDGAYTPAAMIELLSRISPPIAPDINEAPNPATLIQDMTTLRLIESLDDGTYRRWPHLADATPDTMLRYAALTLLIPNGEGYTLPALDAPFDGEPHLASEWPGGAALLAWYNEAGLTEKISSDQWRSRPDALRAVAGSTPTILAINTFLGYLHAARASHDTLPPLSDSPLPLIDPDVLDERIAEIQTELLIDDLTIRRIYRALIAGQHVILSGPPGTGKTHLATLLPNVLWRGVDTAEVHDMTTDPALPPTTPPTTRILERNGYTSTVATATEEWGVRQVIGGITPQLMHDGARPLLVYRVRHGHLTSAVLGNYAQPTSGDLPDTTSLAREEVRENGQRFRGRWLVIDEFTRAPIDAAFGSLLTTLGGQRAPLMVPTDDGTEVALPLPRDFRIIGTLNSFDRHFLNQISEAMKRRFTFIDILPPPSSLSEHELGIAVYRALRKLSDHDFADITTTADSVVWEDVIRATRQTTGDGSVRSRYQISYDDQGLGAVVGAFWRIFRAIRVYRQLGTAQAEAVLTNMFSGKPSGMGWNDALDSALSDVLADQLQVLSRDEQQVILAFLDHAGSGDQFTGTVQTILRDTSAMRQHTHIDMLTRAGAITQGSDQVGGVQIGGAFDLGEALPLDANSLFGRRLRSYINEQGL